MPRATYAELGDACATAHAMELIGARWTYPVLREMMLGPKRFAALQTSVQGITPAVLSARLREMTAAGLIESTTLPPPANTEVYALTPWALQLAPVFRNLGRWAQGSPIRLDQGGLTPDAAIQAMITMAEGPPPSPTIQVQLDLIDARIDLDTTHSYRVEWLTSGLSAERGHYSQAPAAVHCDSTAWSRVLFAGASVQESHARITGDASVVDALIQNFRDGLALV